MATGYSGTFAVEGVTFQMLPTKAGWRRRDNVGFDGNGHPTYPAVREFEISWNLMHPADWAQIINAYTTVQNTGTVSFDLPAYGNANVNFFQLYSGCTISELEQGEYFMGYITDVSLTIYNVRT